MGLVGSRPVHLVLPQEACQCLFVVLFFFPVIAGGELQLDGVIGWSASLCVPIFEIVVCRQIEVSYCNFVYESYEQAAQENGVALSHSISSMDLVHLTLVLQVYFGKHALAFGWSRFNVEQELR